jgi:hypothetical protein
MQTLLIPPLLYGDTAVVYLYITETLFKSPYTLRKHTIHHAVILHLTEIHVKNRVQTLKTNLLRKTLIDVQ